MRMLKIGQLDRPYSLTEGLANHHFASPLDKALILTQEALFFDLVLLGEEFELALNGLKTC